MEASVQVSRASVPMSSRRKEFSQEMNRRVVLGDCLLDRSTVDER